jgi:epoxide hydrolase-like predicted phosphatase
MSDKKQIKAVVFDLGGVVVHSGYLQFMHHYVGKHMSKETKKRIEYLEHKVNLGSMSENEFYRHLQKEFNVHLSTKKMHEKILNSMRANKSLLGLISNLKKSKVAMFSNTLGTIANETFKKQKIPVKKLFSKVFQSHILHIAKPSKGSYEYVVKHLKVKPHEALMVDDRAENIAAARKVGMQGIVFKNTTQFKKALKQYQL